MATPVKKTRNVLGLPRALGSLFLAGCLLTSAVGLPGCGASTATPTSKIDPTTGQTTTYKFVAPTITSIAPNTAALGDTIKVFGKDFIDKQHGTLSLYLNGTFTKDGGGEERGEYTIPLKYVGPGQATFEFGPKVLFSKSGKDLGNFNGTFQVISKLNAPAVNAEIGDIELSEGKNLDLTAGPSIFMTQMRSMDGDCPPVTPGTTPGNNMAFGVELLGMSEATESDPITFSFTFNSPGLVASYIDDKTYAFWPYTGDGTPAPAADTTGTATFSYNITSGTATTVDPKNIEQSVNVDPPVTIRQGTGTQSVVKLSRLAVGKADDMTNQNGSSFNLVITASRGDGSSITRTLNVPIYRALTISDPTPEKLAGREAATAASGCVSGSNFGNDYQYSEGDSQTRSRSINLTWNTNLGAHNDYQVGGTAEIGIPFIGAASVNINATTGKSWSETFGVDVNDSVTTETHKNYTSSIKILPGQWAVSYRQAIWFQRTATMLVHNSCGDAIEAGTATLNNPQWNFDIEQGPTCDLPSSPATKLPEAMGDTPNVK